MSTTPTAAASSTSTEAAADPPVTQLPVVVIGAGPVGLAAAAHLLEYGLDVLSTHVGDTPVTTGP
ncbi:FAD-dependent monooxygenase [Kineococcus sp. DHX-1]|uniref:FAD-dependent monooxygenase n=1 Tax=Kineococcus sp. DHX-1 TaxID=3349638 RepID=UPI0036D25285